MKKKAFCSSLKRATFSSPSSLIAYYHIFHSLIAFQTMFSSCSCLLLSRYPDSRFIRQERAAIRAAATAKKNEVRRDSVSLLKLESH